MNESDCKRRCLEKMAFWSALSASDRTKILSASYLRIYEPGSVIHTQDGDCLGLLYLREGNIRTSMISEDGREITLYHLREGDYDVLSASCVVNQITFDTHMTATLRCSILIVPASILAVFKASNVHVRCFIFETLSMRFSDVMWTMQQTLFMRVDQRLAGYLLERLEESVSEREAGDRAVAAAELALTHEQIAQEINTAREVVARMMRNFASDGLVEGRRGKIVIKDAEGLRKIL